MKEVKSAIKSPLTTNNLGDYVIDIEYEPKPELLHNSENDLDPCGRIIMLWRAFRDCIRGVNAAFLEHDRPLPQLGKNNTCACLNPTYVLFVKNDQAYVSAAKRSEWRGFVVVGRMCVNCSSAMLRPEGGPSQVCYKCGGSMIYDGIEPLVAQAEEALLVKPEVIHLFRCKRCSHQTASTLKP